MLLCVFSDAKLQKNSEMECGQREKVIGKGRTWQIYP